MRIIITETQHHKIINLIKNLEKKRGHDFNLKIIVANTAKEVPDWVKSHFYEGEDIREKYIKAFGTIYIIKNDDDWFILQKQNDKWFIADEYEDIMSEFELMKRLGILKYGIDIETLLGLK